MKPILSTVCCLALCSLAASAQAPGKDGPKNDQEFINMAAQTDMLEAHLGQMAADQAGTPAVKAYAQMLVSDHTADYQQLNALAAKDGFTVPKALDADHNKMIVPFEHLKGAAFDAKYAHEMIMGHSQAIAIYTQESTGAQNPDVKSYAGATLPTLNKHLDSAKELAKKPAK